MISSHLLSVCLAFLAILCSRALPTNAGVVTQLNGTCSDARGVFALSSIELYAACNSGGSGFGSVLQYTRASSSVSWANGSSVVDLTRISGGSCTGAMGVYALSSTEVYAACSGFPLGGVLQYTRPSPSALWANGSAAILSSISGSACPYGAQAVYPVSSTEVYAVCMIGSFSNPQGALYQYTRSSAAVPWTSGSAVTLTSISGGSCSGGFIVNSVFARSSTEVYAACFVGGCGGSPCPSAVLQYTRPSESASWTKNGSAVALTSISGGSCSHILGLSVLSATEVYAACSGSVLQYSRPSSSASWISTGSAVSIPSSSSCSTLFTLSPTEVFAGCQTSSQNALVEYKRSSSTASWSTASAASLVASNDSSIQGLFALSSSEVYLTYGSAVYQYTAPVTPTTVAPTTPSNVPSTTSPAGSTSAPPSGTSAAPPPTPTSSSSGLTASCSAFESAAQQSSAYTSAQSTMASLNTDLGCVTACYIKSPNKPCTCTAGYLPSYVAQYQAACQQINPTATIYYGTSIQHSSAGGVSFDLTQYNGTFICLPPPPVCTVADFQSIVTTLAQQTLAASVNKTGGSQTVTLEYTVSGQTVSGKASNSISAAGRTTGGGACSVAVSAVAALLFATAMLQ